MDAEQLPKIPYYDRCMTLIDLLRANANNNKVDDKQFRAFVRNSLPEPISPNRGPGKRILLHVEEIKMSGEIVFTVELFEAPRGMPHLAKLTLSASATSWEKFPRYASIPELDEHVKKAISRMARCFWDGVFKKTTGMVLWVRDYTNGGITA